MHGATQALFLRVCVPVQVQAPYHIDSAWVMLIKACNARKLDQRYRRLL